MKDQNQIDWSELKQYNVTRPSVELRRCATQLVERKGHEYVLLLTREIALAFDVK